MPVSTSQASPRASMSTSSTIKPSSHSVNAKKRPGSEPSEELRETKRIKVGGESLSAISMNAKEKKKKKNRKKKRKSQIIPLNPPVTNPTGSSKGAPTDVLSPIKRETVVNGSVAEEDFGESDTSEPVSSSKGKGKAKSSSPVQVVARQRDTVERSASGSGSTILSEEITMQASEIARLKEQLIAKDKLLVQHQNHFSNHQQSLTCQICLDLLYKPYALAPCGHITCYGCLVRWFTAPQQPEAPGVNEPRPDDIETLLDSAAARNGAYMYRRKKCPVCRAVVSDRPIVMWGIKDMVSALVRSGLVDLPSQTHPVAEEGNSDVDPWRNVFRKAANGGGRPFAAAWNAFFPHAANPAPEQAEGQREDMGWHDAEDGGIYRCLDCYHEIWQGVCTRCHRRYAGHATYGLDDDDDEEDDDESMFDMRLRYEYDDEDEEEEYEHDLFLPQWMMAEAEEQDDEEHHHPPPLHWNVFGGSEGSDDGDSENGSEDESDRPHGGGRRDGPARHSVFDRYGVADDDEGEGEGEESDYGGSFIDDGIDGAIEVSAGEENDDDEVEFIETPAVRRARRRAPEDEPNVIDLDEDEDEEPVSDIIRNYLRRRAGPHWQHHILDSTSEDEDEDEEEEEEAPVQEIRQRRRTRRIPLASDEEEEE